MRSSSRESPEAATTIRDNSRAYLRSSTFWVLTISAPILWGLVIYLLAQFMLPGFR